MSGIGNSLNKEVLFISHREKQCGVHQFGLDIARVLKKSNKYSFIYAECSDVSEYDDILLQHDPIAIIYNYHPSTLAWVKRKLIKRVGVPHIEIIHEVTQQVADQADDSLFDFHIAPDPSLLLKNPAVFKTGRLIRSIENDDPLPEITTIGSFGFATQGKGFETLVTAVQEEFNNAKINLNIPYAAFGDSDGFNARQIARRCRSVIVKPGIELEIGHEFMTPGELNTFLCHNTLNAFFYADKGGRGISSAVDHALAAQRPIAITRSSMFRHIYSAVPSICIEDSSLKDIIENGTGPLECYRKDWSEENLIWDYERIIANVLERQQDKPVTGLREKFQRFAKKHVPAKNPARNPDYWVPSPDNEKINELRQQDTAVERVSIANVSRFNRILDNEAREQYKPCIDALFDLVPELMARKIPEANIQQAFVFDTVNKFAASFDSARILCVGSFEDTAFAALKKCGYMMDEVDPVINYDLDTYMDKPANIGVNFDIIFATSVIEHIRGDERFIAQVAKLLAPGGVAILTCDFNDQYQPEDKIPTEDFHMYTQKDIKERLLPCLQNCSLIDDPQWQCPQPDFLYSGYRYTFASIVFRKNQL